MRHLRRLYRTMACAALLASPLSSLAADPVRVIPSHASPLTVGPAFLERQFSPLEALQIQGKLTSLGVQNILHIDLGAEHLLVRLPAKPGGDGRYGVMVYLDFRAQSRLPMGWNNPLDSHGIIFVSPDNAGDDASALDRRIPLALDAYEYARSKYKLDPDRVYVAGVSGGGRIAEKLALAYPDVFSAAIVNSGAAELGTREIPAPSLESLALLRTHSRLLFVTAKRDEPAFTDQRHTVASLHRYCVPLAAVFEPGNIIAGRANIDGLSLSDMLNTIEAPRRAVESSQAGCEQALHDGALSALENVKQLGAGGSHAEAVEALAAFDHAYGHLFPVEEMALAKQVEPGSSGSAPPASVEPPESH